MSFTLTPEVTRNRKDYTHQVPKSFGHILNSSTGPRLQMQYNDANNKCICLCQQKHICVYRYVYIYVYIFVYIRRNALQSVHT